MPNRNHFSPEDAAARLKEMAERWVQGSGKPPNVRTRLLAALTLVAACASHPGTPQPLPAALSPRCQAVTDSIAAVTELGALPEGGFREAGRYRMPSLPANTPSGTRVLIRYVARPDGTAEPGTIEIRGIEDAGFRSRALTAIRSVHLLPASIDGCPVRSRVDVYTTKL